MNGKAFPIRGFNLVESVLRHTPDQLRRFVRRMKSLNMNSLILHYDYGFRRYGTLLMEECAAAGIEIRLMVFGPRTVFRFTDWTEQDLAKAEDGRPFTTRLECETWPCRANPGVLERYAEGCRKLLETIPKQISILQMRSADGFFSCRCPVCRNHPVRDNWQPFLKIFQQTARQIRPDLKLEADCYVRRYDFPSDMTVSDNMDYLMYDTFFRQVRFPLGEPSSNLCDMPYAADGPVDANLSPNVYHAERIRAWTQRCPGKIYLHENCMLQSNQGIFQPATGVYLRDLDFLRTCHAEGILYEAFEPGFSRFEELFGILSDALCGKTVLWKPDRREQLFCSRWNGGWMDRDQKPESVFSGEELEQIRLVRTIRETPSIRAMRRFIEFLFERADHLDYLFITFQTLLEMKRKNGLEFPGISEPAADLLGRRKLWDFMEDIPDDEDPRAATADLLLELAEHARGPAGGL